MLLVHQVTCFCRSESLITTTIHRDGRATSRFEGGLPSSRIGERQRKDGIEPVRFSLDDDEISEIDDALAQVGFMDLPVRIERGEGASPVSDLRAIKVTHNGHTVRERTHLDLSERPPRPGDEPPEPLTLILAPVDQLIEEQLAGEMRPEVERR